MTLHRWLVGLICGAIVACLGGVAAGQARITEPQVTALLETLDHAARSSNTEALIIHFSDDCIITLEIPGPEGAHRFRWNKEEYARELDEGYKETEDYAVERTETAIRIAPDGLSATVTATVTETMRARHRIIRAVSREVARLELREGRLVVTRLDGVVLEFEQSEAVEAVRARLTPRRASSTVREDGADRSRHGTPKAAQNPAAPLPDN